MQTPLTARQAKQLQTSWTEKQPTGQATAAVTRESNRKRHNWWQRIMQQHNVVQEIQVRCLCAQRRQKQAPRQMQQKVRFQLLRLPLRSSLLLPVQHQSRRRQTISLRLPLLSRHRTSAQQWLWAHLLTRYPSCAKRHRQREPLPLRVLQLSPSQAGAPPQMPHPWLDHARIPVQRDPQW
mmetsp:Transcript_60843/g.166759  ORF Transcript_60843/g.166759 Transcript_60843/m.166759 type:complete len:180 (+) Transcript_60843:597-1136(+)